MERILRLVLVTCLLLVPATSAAAPATPRALDQDPPPGSFELLGHEPLENRGMNAALAVYRGYAYIGSRTDNHGQGNAGVMVVDVSKPTEPKVVSKIEEPHENNEGETSREMRIWQEQELLVVMNLFSNCGEIHACSPRSGDDNYRFYDISGENAANPKFVAEYKPSENPHEFFLWDDPKRPGRALLFQSTPGGSTQFLVTDISGARDKKFEEIFKGSFGGEGSLHSLTVTPDGKTGYLAHLQGGFMMIDTSDFAAAEPKPKVRILTPPANAPKWDGPGAHSAAPVFGGKWAFVADEVYGEALAALGHGCPWGWVRMIDTTDPSKPKVKAEYKLDPYNDPSYCNSSPPRCCSSLSAHNPTLTKNLAIITWHSGGLQAIDISDPAKPTQAAEYLPDPLPFVVTEDPVLSSGQDKVVMWSFPIIQAGLIYVSDIRNGLYILRYKGPFEDEVSKIKFLEGNSNQGDALNIFGAGGGGGGGGTDRTGCTITGKAGRDVLRGTPRADIICAKGGNDVIRAAGGNDIVRAGTGNDVLKGGGGSDDLRGGGGRDALYGGGGKDTLNGGRGKDGCSGGRGDDRIRNCEGTKPPP